MAALKTSEFGAVRAVFTDVDGTLTTDGRLKASTFAAIESLAAAGIPVVVVTGRPAGWADAFVRQWPIRAAIAENGGVIFLGGPTVKKLLAVPEKELVALRRRMHRVAKQAMKQVRGARLSPDAAYTEVNLALDWNEEIHLGEAAARRLESALRHAGFQAVRSSVHVNFWPHGFDKLTACRTVARRLFPRSALHDFIYVGDALNDEPMFRGFPRSVGVANVRKVWDELEHHPWRVTPSAEGAGFEEVARAIVRAHS